MTRLSAWKMAAAVLLLVATTTIAAQAQTFNTLVNFEGTNGAGPDRISLVQGTDGAFYGTTLGGGANNASDCKENLVLVPGCGTVFKITSDGTLTTLYSFCAQPNCTDGYGPFGGLVQGTDGNFYGTTEYGGTVGAGTVFKITPEGTLATMYNFCSQQPPQCSDGEEPVGALVQGIDGNFYGTTIFGDGSGNIFKMTPQGSLTSLFSFDGKDGTSPNGGLIQATDGNFYGTTNHGGRGSGCYNPYGCGTVFRITPSGTFTSLYSFCTKSDCSTGSEPAGGLVQAADGSLFGTTAEVGEYPTGTIFKIDQDGKLTTVYEFCSQPNCADGSEPIGALIQATDGNFYGATIGGGDSTCNSGNGGGCGTVFELNHLDGTLTTLHTFEDTDGSNPAGSFLQATNGTLYGTTLFGGEPLCDKSYGCGTVFSLSMGLGQFVTFVRAAGKVGQTGGILGQGFTGTTGVSLNGTPASFTVVSDTFIRATVPAGATTGYVTVATPSGTLTSNVPFHVIR